MKSRNSLWMIVPAMLLCICGLCFVEAYWALPASQTIYAENAAVLVLDAGHGGEDGGAVSEETGAIESHINLAITKKMDDILGLYGVVPVLIREDDRSMHDADCVTLREKKGSDLKNRVDIVNNVSEATLLSIHQNSFPEAKYHGTQTFYADTDGSRELAEQIQSAICRTLQSENRREAKRIPDTVYLMNHVDCRAVLVECGFLTNPEEAQQLQTDNYQKKLSSVLSAVWLMQTM